MALQVIAIVMLTLIGLFVVIQSLRASILSFGKAGIFYFLAAIIVPIIGWVALIIFAVIQTIEDFAFSEGDSN